MYRSTGVSLHVAAAGSAARQASSATDSSAFCEMQTLSVIWGNSCLKIIFSKVRCRFLTSPDPRRRPPLRPQSGQALLHIKDKLSADSLISDCSQMFTWHQYQGPDVLEGRLC